MTTMKSLKGREQGTWNHPALFEIGRVIGYCSRMNNERVLGPCKTRSYIKRSQWCEVCVAQEALTELGAILKRSEDHRTCSCDDCLLLGKYLEIGADNDKKYGIH